MLGPVGAWAEHDQVAFSKFGPQRPILREVHAACELQQRYAQRKYIALLSAALFQRERHFEKFRGHVDSVACLVVVRNVLAQIDRQAEVGQFYLAGLGDEEVGRLDVQVDVAVLVHVLDAAGHLLQNLPDLVFAEHGHAAVGLDK